MTFYGCYLLSSKHERAKGRTYIGFTVNPHRRIRQHNGLIVNGAFRTRKWRPWDMVLVVYGFPTQVTALQFEWAWQHPDKSLAVREAAKRIGRKAMYGLQGKVLLLFEMRQLSPWCFYPLTVQILDSKYSHLRAGCPAPPDHISVVVAPIDFLPKASVDGPHAEDRNEGDSSTREEDQEQPFEQCSDRDDNGDVYEQDMGQQEEDSMQPDQGRGCSLCGKALGSWWASCCTCNGRTHVECMANHFIQNDPQGGSIPTFGSCPTCKHSTSWMDVLHNLGSVGWAAKKSRKGRRRKKSTAKGAQAATQPAAQTGEDSTSAVAPEPSPCIKKQPEKTTRQRKNTQTKSSNEPPQPKGAKVAKRSTKTAQRKGTKKGGAPDSGSPADTTLDTTAKANIPVGVGNDNAFPAASGAVSRSQGATFAPDGTNAALSSPPGSSPLLDSYCEGQLSPQPLAQRLQRYVKQATRHAIDTGLPCLPPDPPHRPVASYQQGSDTSSSPRSITVVSTWNTTATLAAVENNLCARPGANHGGQSEKHKSAPTDAMGVAFISSSNASLAAQSPPQSAASDFESNAIHVVHDLDPWDVDPSAIQLVEPCGNESPQALAVTCADASWLTLAGPVSPCGVSETVSPAVSLSNASTPGVVDEYSSAPRSTDLLTHGALACTTACPAPRDLPPISLGVPNETEEIPATATSLHSPKITRSEPVTRSTSHSASHHVTAPITSTTPHLDNLGQHAMDASAPQQPTEQAGKHITHTKAHTVVNRPQSSFAAAATNNDGSFLNQHHLHVHRGSSVLAAASEVDKFLTAGDDAGRSDIGRMGCIFENEAVLRSPVVAASERPQDSGTGNRDCQTPAAEATTQTGPSDQYCSFASTPDSKACMRYESSARGGSQAFLHTGTTPTMQVLSGGCIEEQQSPRVCHATTPTMQVLIGGSIEEQQSPHVCHAVSDGCSVTPRTESGEYGAGTCHGSGPQAWGMADRNTLERQPLEHDVEVIVVSSSDEEADWAEANGSGLGVLHRESGGRPAVGMHAAGDELAQEDGPEGAKGVRCTRKRGRRKKTPVRPLQTEILFRCTKTQFPAAASGTGLETKGCESSCEEIMASPSPLPLRKRLQCRGVQSALGLLEGMKLQHELSQMGAATEGGNINSTSGAGTSQNGLLPVVQREFPVQVIELDD